MKQFCDKKINFISSKKKCPRCSLILYTKHCEEGHFKLCNGKGHFGWYCSKCKHFTYKTENLTSKEVEKRHKCGTTICRICRKYFNETENHCCRLREEKATKFWPNLVFLNIEFCEINEDHCTSCFELKKHFKEKNECTWKDVFQSEKFPQLSCTEHSNQQKICEPMIFMISKENRANRGDFTCFSISNSCNNETFKNQLYYNYYECIKTQNKFVPSKLLPKSCQELKKKLETNFNNISN